MKATRRLIGIRSIPSIYSLLLLVLLISFSSCLTPRKLDKSIDRHYGSTVPAKVKSNDLITIKTDALKRSDKVSTTQKGTKKVVPAIFYWQWELTTVSTLNPYIPASQFGTAVLPYANAKGLRQKLNGQKLELTIEGVPGVFDFTRKGHMIYLLLFYVGSEKTYIDPKKTELVVSYRVLNGTTETRKGVIHIANRDQPVSLKAFQSTRRMISIYLDQYANNVKAMSKELVDKLMVELEQGSGIVQAGSVQ